VKQNYTTLCTKLHVELYKNTLLCRCDRFNVREDLKLIDNYNMNSSGDEIANVNFYAVRPEATRIRWNNVK